MITRVIRFAGAACILSPVLKIPFDKIKREIEEITGSMLKLPGNREDFQATSLLHA
jgi:hypothetical protein